MAEANEHRVAVVVTGAPVPSAGRFCGTQLYEAEWYVGSEEYMAVAAGAPAAIAAASEDPKSFGKSLIFVALGESIALYGVVISILILNKLV